MNNTINNVVIAIAQPPVYRIVKVKTEFAEDVLLLLGVEDVTPKDFELAGYVPADEMPDELRCQRNDWQRKAESLLTRAATAERELREMKNALVLQKDTVTRLRTKLLQAEVERDEAIISCTALADFACRQERELAHRAAPEEREP